ncbi:MAG TPA: UbiA family prenyltransferase [Tepidisphaeraceae bacterium]|nr:UbiA family prenyltransferase [Tepidisphaeraceae bacterium]
MIADGAVQLDPALSEADASVLSAERGSVPLCVDLDGTLIATDSFWEALLLLAKHHSLDALRAPAWAAAGLGRLKEQVARRVRVDPALLPYRKDVLEFLWEQKRAGRRIVLATASHQSVADAVAAYHAGLFDEVIGTGDGPNLKGRNKLAELERRFGTGNFDYMGDSAADVCLWRAARRAYVVYPENSALRQAKAVCTPYQVFPRPGRAKPLLKALRPHQWVKNFLLLIPLILAHQLGNHAKVLAGMSAFVSFSFCASAIYIINDLLDLESDRRHPSKRRRPFASGALSVATGLMMSGGLLLASFGIAASLPMRFIEMLLVYLILTTAYSFWLKRKMLVDVILLATLYTQRIIAGAFAVSVPLTMWLLAFSMFFFLSLAFAKRYSELLQVEDAGGEQIKGRGYRVSDLGIIESVGPASGYLSVLVFCNYLNTELVKGLYARPALLWGVAPLLLYWITRVWFLARRREMHDDPIVFAIRDKMSWGVGACVGLVVIAAWVR